MQNSLRGEGRCVVEQQYGTTMKSLRLENERENLDYLLSHAELTEEERSALKNRLVIVKEELLNVFTATLPS
jgi:hypothetical protein